MEIILGLLTLILNKMKFLQNLENNILNADLNAARKKLNMQPLTEEEKQALNKERNDKRKLEKEESKREDKEFNDKINIITSKCNSFAWKVIKAQLGLIYLIILFGSLWFLFG
jgi:uncharacterized membrane protein YcgQ (UPF0703/DUF1980 family)